MLHYHIFRTVKADGGRWSWWPWLRRLNSIPMFSNSFMLHSLFLMDMMYWLLRYVIMQDRNADEGKLISIRIYLWCDRWLHRCALCSLFDHKLHTDCMNGHKNLHAWNVFCIFFFSSRRRHTRLQGDWSSDVCSSDLVAESSLLSRFIDDMEHASPKKSNRPILTFNY